MSVTSLPLFRGMHRDQLDAALDHFNFVQVPFGTRLMEEGDSDNSMVVVVAGQLEVSTGDVVLGTARAGDIIGEVALFGEGVRSASVESSTDAELLILDRAGYITLRNLDNPVAHSIELQALEHASNRLRSVGVTISRMAEGTPVEHVTPSAGFFSRVASLFGRGGVSPGARGVDVRAALAASPLFADATPAALEELGQNFQACTAATGTFVCTEGEPGGDMYILVDGAVDVIIETEGDNVEPVAHLEAGDAFGMGALIEPDRPRMASCVVTSDATLLAMDRDTWSRVSQDHDQAASVLRTAVLRSLVEQLAYANSQIAILDIEKQYERTGSRLAPLVRASAGFEAHGQHLRAN